ncbi:MAG TPA: protein translocase subunit SecD [Firmicutes bacterium]|nr:protein translocase subunit SecD [Bacillota bacterium]
MRKDLRWKFWVTIFLGFLCVIFVVLPYNNPNLKALFFKGQDPVRQGLDLQGGIEVILTPDYRVERRVLAGIMNELRDAVTGINVTSPTIRLLGRPEQNRYEGLELVFDNREEVERVLAARVIRPEMTWRSGAEEKRLKVRAEASTEKPEVLRVFFSEDPRNFPKDALAQARIIIENRINASGLSEPAVWLDEANQRLQIQLPGITTQEEAERLIQTTGRLNFRLGNRVVMFGSDLTDARAEIDPREGAPVINFKFGRVGARQFEEITRDHVGEVLAIYLDEELLMEPMIREPIPGGEGRITLGRGSTLKEAKEYAVLMKSGALPVSLRTIQITQVAPTLGSEIVRQSLLAAGIGLCLVFLFMVGFYGIPGLLANAALVIYGLLVLGIMALFRGVLTLPGVAGFILSIGMAVDANILIFERIKDEIWNGKTMRAALAGGFDRAFTAILDANVTTLIVALVLLFLGTGTVRGFAVTLTIGILASMFTALVVTRVFMEILINRNPGKIFKRLGGGEVQA